MKKIYIFTILVILATPFVLFAADTYHLLAPLGNSLPADIDASFGLDNYILSFFKIGIAVAGVLAVVMFVIGGITYMISDVVGEKESAKGMMTNAVFGLLLALGAFAILNTINPTILSLQFVGGGGETGGEAPIPEGNNGNDDSSLACTGTVEELPSGFIYTGGNKVKPSLKTKLIAFKSSLDGSALAGWRVTEACPRTRPHANQCHYNGTCIDASFPSQIGSSETGSVFAQRVLLFINKANDAGLRAVFETQSQAQRDYLVNTGGIPAANTLVWQNITAPHFSVYCNSCQ